MFTGTQIHQLRVECGRGLMCVQLLYVLWFICQSTYVYVFNIHILYIRTYTYSMHIPSHTPSVRMQWKAHTCNISLGYGPLWVDRPLEFILCYSITWALPYIQMYIHTLDTVNFDPFYLICRIASYPLLMLVG